MSACFGASGSGPVGRDPKPVLRWASVLGLLPIPLWFLVVIARDPGPAWQAEYWSESDVSGTRSRVSERQLSRYWDREHARVTGGLGVHGFSARWETCLRLDSAREIPFMLVALGVARFELDGEEKLQITAEGERATRGAVLPLQAGVHHLSVAFSAHGWPSIGLYASFDGGPPLGFPTDAGSPGVHFSHPAPGDRPCSEH